MEDISFFSDFRRIAVKVKEDEMVETCVQDDLAVCNTSITKRDVQKKTWLTKLKYETWGKPVE